MPGLTLRKEDQEPLFCGAMPAPSSLEEVDMVEAEMEVRRDSSG